MVVDGLTHAEELSAGAGLVAIFIASHSGRGGLGRLFGLGRPSLSVAPNARKTLAAYRRGCRGYSWGWCFIPWYGKSFGLELAAVFKAVR